MSPPVVLDLFCGEGGAAKGYAKAGLRPFGVDNQPQPRYPFPCYEGDWRTGLFYWLNRYDFDLIHASPPCQGYSDLANSHPEIDYPMLIEPVREALKATGLPYVIENVEGAPLIDPVTLCATNFPDTTVEWKGETYQLQRHRLFETNWPLEAMFACTHVHRTFPVYGHGYPNNMPWFQGAPMAKFAREVMQTPWMTRDGFCEAIPPYYTEYIANEFWGYLNQRGGLAA